MTKTDYPRDLAGYGRTPPNPHWPGKARIAVQFVINYEEGGENNILHGDAASEAFLSEIVGAAPWPGQRHMNMEFDLRIRLARRLSGGSGGCSPNASMPVTVFAVASALQRYPEIAASMQEAGWEIATHGLKWIDYRDVPAEKERADILEAIRIQRELTGERPLGFYQGRTSERTTPLMMEEGGFLYTADSYADELPYWLAGPKGPQLSVPYTLDANDMRFATPQGFNSGDQFFAYLKDTFDTLYAEGETGAEDDVDRPALPARRPTRPRRGARTLPRPCPRRTTRVWVATRLDIARHWIRHHPPAGGYRPSARAEGALRRGLRPHLGERALGRRSDLGGRDHRRP